VIGRYLWIVGALLAGIAACEETGAKPTKVVDASGDADQILEGFSHYVTFGGVRRSRVEADTAFFYEGTQITELRHLKVIFYDLRGVEGSTLTARKGTYRWQDGSMEADENVVVVNPDGRTLRTQKLKYDNATNTISTDVPFTFDRADEHLEGNSFKSDPDFKNVVTDQPRGIKGGGILLPGQKSDSEAPAASPAPRRAPNPKPQGADSAKPPSKPVVKPVSPVKPSAPRTLPGQKD
jgi:LPS export ABC transporter protein LptC